MSSPVRPRRASVHSPLSRDPRYSRTTPDQLLARIVHARGRVEVNGIRKVGKEIRAWEGYLLAAVATNARKTSLYDKTKRSKLLMKLQNYLDIVEKKNEENLSGPAPPQLQSQETETRGRGAPRCDASDFGADSPVGRLSV